MEKITKLGWSGLTGRTGREAILIAAEMPDVEIVAGLSRLQRSDNDEVVRKMRVGASEHIDRFEFAGVEWYQYSRVFDAISHNLHAELYDIDGLVDFSDPDVFDDVLRLAIYLGKPLISGTSGLSDGQIASLYDATNYIPVFRGGNFRFKVKKFIDEAVELAKKEKGRLDLYENFYKGKSLPSETSKVIQRRISEATGKTVEVHSSDTFAEGNLICDWELRTQRRLSPTAMKQEKVHCRTIGFDELAHDVLEIAKVMADKPLKPGEFYDLDEIWDDIPESAKMI